MAEPLDAPGSAGDPGVLVETRDSALWITLDRPASLNALTEETTRDLTEAILGARGRDDIRVVVITGRGAAFSAGADLALLRSAQQRPVEVMDGASALVRAVVGLDVPVLAAVNGIAAGVACSLALAADLVVAAESAAFLLPFARLGLMNDGGSSLSVAASIGRARAMRMALLAEPMPAREALACGLISHVAPDAEFPALVDTLVARLGAGAPLAQAGIKKAVNAATLEGLEDALAREHTGQRALFTTADLVEGLAAFDDRRRPVFRGE